MLSLSLSRKIARAAAASSPSLVLSLPMILSARSSLPLPSPLSAPHIANPSIRSFGVRNASSSSSASTPSGTKDIKDIGALLDASSSGNVDLIKSILSRGLAVNDGDYDRRRPLHLATAEGRVEAIKYLVENGADTNAEDRWGNTPLDEAISARNDEAIQILKKFGGQIGKVRMAEMGSILCLSAAEGNEQHLHRLFSCGVDMNRSNHDLRTPLHVAASEGHASTVEFLLRHGAKPNVVDRFSNTPLSDASRSRSKNRKAVMDILKAYGAQMESDNYDISTDPLLTPSIHRSLPFIAARMGVPYLEVWVPSDDGTELNLLESAQYISKDHAAKITGFTSVASSSYANNTGNIVGRAWSSRSIQVFNEILEKDIPSRYAKAKEAGLKSGVVIPLVHNQKPFCLLKLFALEPNKFAGLVDASHAVIACSGIVLAGVHKNGSGQNLPPFADIPDRPAGQMAEVFERIVAEEVFNANLVYHEVEWFYNLGLQKYYFERFSSSQIANHIHAFIAAKKVAATTGKPEDVMLNIESNSAAGSSSWLYMCPIQHDKQVEVENRIQSQIMKIPNNRAFTLEFFMSQKTVVPQGTKQLGLFVLETSEWNNPQKFGQATESNLSDVASATFLKSKSPEIRNRYQSLLASTVHKLSPLAEIYPTYRDGTTPVMFSFYQAAGTTTSYMLQLTELLKHNGLVANRKFIETFANGVIVYSLYLQPCSRQLLDNLLKQFSMLHLTPESSLTTRFLSGEYTADQYTYNSAVSRFVYYFLNRRSEEFDVLAKALKDDNLNLGRLRLLQTRLKREAVSQERIYSCLTNHPQVVNALFKDFVKAAATNQSKPPIGAIELNSEILNMIKRESTTVLDQQILTGLLTFNAHVLKTNFYTKSKAALSFRLDPRFLQDSDWPLIPFGLFFVMGSDFQGFHIRFRDIARGGIRIIRSGDRQTYNHNLESLFAENFGLAYTQNKKNKDIPEFGSKGTILLNINQSNPFLAFQKYTSAILDLLIKNADINDNYGREEILFFGPDEGTADYMEWAARYAAKRSYPYWRSFTTGKPPSLGGIPHDRFGMTTRSVHRYVIGCLEKLGLKEENVMKFQTGGPDGDLGSNEILIAKDRTRAVVDGSGVIYDPNGLDREELKILATKRQMIKFFDTSKLSSGGFRVLVTDSKVKLPNGEVVDSGLVFRNEFHLHPLSSADLFVPCGGRPESVNLTNVNKLFDSKGLPRFRIIVEGANLFFTQDARMVLENAGVILYKDASANKGGVTSSSLEVLAALALSADEFEQHMSVKDERNIPSFYSTYVKDIQLRIEADAGLEFECIWREHERTKTPRYLLTDQVSDKINALNEFVQESSLWKNKDLRRIVLHAALPKPLTDLVGLDTLMKRVPESYLQAIFGAHLASRYVYKHGLNANEMAFFEFMQPYLKQLPK